MGERKKNAAALGIIPTPKSIVDWDASHGIIHRFDRNGFEHVTCPNFEFSRASMNREEQVRRKLEAQESAYGA